MKKNKIAVISAGRSPVGKIPGIMNHIGETDLLAKIIQAVCKGYENRIDEAVLGSSFPIERDNLCRKALLCAGLSPDISCSTVSKTCASSDEALLIAVSKIRTGKAKTVLVCGSEKTGNSSYILHFMKQNIKHHLKNQLPNFQDIQDHILENDMAYICEYLAKKYHISREVQDAFTIKSIQKALAARAHFSEEIIPILHEENGMRYHVYEDDLLCSERPEEKISNAAPMFMQTGTLTQYNAAAICECAAAMLIMDREEAARRGITPLAFIVDTDCIGVPKAQIGHAMTACTDKILKKNGLNKRNIDLYEINESFAAQAIFTARMLGLDTERINVNGGNLALGYPIGATGLRMQISLIYEMRRRGASMGLSVICAGGNMANASLYTNEP